MLSLCRHCAINIEFQLMYNAFSLILCVAIRTGSGDITFDNISAGDLELMYQLHQTRRGSLPSEDCPLQVRNGWIDE